MNQIDISEMSVIELKGLAFDIGLDRDRAQANLNAIYVELEKRQKDEEATALKEAAAAEKAAKKGKK